MNFTRLMELISKQLYALMGGVGAFERRAAFEAQQLLREGRLDLMDVCAPPESGLGRAVEKLGGSVMSFGKHNEYDLRTNTGYRRASETLALERPRRVVFPPPCTARSIIQNGASGRLSSASAWGPSVVRTTR